MSEPIPACLAIGGRLPKRLVARLCRAIIADGVALEWGDAPFRPQTAQELLESCREEKGVRVLWVCDEQANWGRLPALEAFLTERAKLSFDLRSEGKAEFDADVVTFRPGQKPTRIVTTANGEPVIAAHLLVPVIKELAGAIRVGRSCSSRAWRERGERALARLQALTPPPITPLAPFEIV